MRRGFEIFLLVLFFTSCDGASESKEKYYVNLRFTKNTALFLCKAPEGVAATYRANNDALDGTGSWRIEAYSDNDMKNLANKYCKEKHGMK